MDVKKRLFYFLWPLIECFCFIIISLIYSIIALYFVSMEKFQYAIPVLAALTVAQAVLCYFVFFISIRSCKSPMLFLIVSAAIMIGAWPPFATLVGIAQGDSSSPRDTYVLDLFGFKIWDAQAFYLTTPLALTTYYALYRFVREKWLSKKK